MKRILTLVLAAAFILGTVGGAQAIDVKASGFFAFSFGWADQSFNKDESADEDKFIAAQRMRTQVNFIASEQLQGVMQFEIGTSKWGRPGGFAQMDADDDTSIKVKRAYLDWMIPNSEVSVRMGVQDVAMPSAAGFGNPIMNSDVAGIVVNAPINEMFAITALWARPFDQEDSDNDNTRHDEMDFFALSLPITGEGWKVNPWAAYSFIGNASGVFDYINGGYTGIGSGLSAEDDYYTYHTTGEGKTKAWWGGLGVNIDVLDPLTFAFDVMYGHMNNAHLTATATSNTPWNAYPDVITVPLGAVSMDGWLIDAALDYKMDWATAGIYGWYSTGDDASDVKDGEFGRMPALGFDRSFAHSSYGSYNGMGSGNVDGIIGTTFMGTWGIGVKLAEMSFVEDLSHTLRLAYYMGTNDHEVAENGDVWFLSGESVYLTDKDNAIEVNFDHQYKIYENLRAVLELGYIHLSMDDDVWGDYYDHKNNWKSQMYLEYSF